MAREADGARGFAAEFLWQLDLIETRLTGLAEALSEEQYRFRPSPDARAFGEVMLHVAAGNRLAWSALGGPAVVPADLARLEAAPLQKAAVLKALRESLATLRGLAGQTSDFESETALFGRTVTKREVFFIVAGHMHQHLGQLIAYARMNGLAPPWSKAA